MAAQRHRLEFSDFPGGLAQTCQCLFDVQHSVIQLDERLLQRLQIIDRLMSAQMRHPLKLAALKASNVVAQSLKRYLDSIKPLMTFMLHFQLPSSAKVSGLRLTTCKNSERGSGMPSQLTPDNPTIGRVDLLGNLLDVVARML